MELTAQFHVVSRVENISTSYTTWWHKGKLMNKNMENGMAR